MISLDYEFFSEYEQEAFFAAFFKFVEAVSVEEANSIIITTGELNPACGRHLTFETESLAKKFANYWQQRKSWLGLDQYEPLVS